MSAAAAKIEPSLVTIAVQSGGSGGIGSGVVLDKDGHILTNNHVIAAAAQGGEITVTFHNGTTATAKIIGTSESNDLAVIKVDGVNDLNPATFAKSSELMVGQTVVAAGAPLGLAGVGDEWHRVQHGSPGPFGQQQRCRLSGGADRRRDQPGQLRWSACRPQRCRRGHQLLDRQHQLGCRRRPAGNIGIGFAIPSDVASRVASELITTGKSSNAALGVTVAGSDSEVSTCAGVPLQEVISGGAAEKAGLRAGDVVTKINDFQTTTPMG